MSEVLVNTSLLTNLANADRTLSEIDTDKTLATIIQNVKTTNLELLSYSYWNADTSAVSSITVSAERWQTALLLVVMGQTSFGGQIKPAVYVKTGPITLFRLSSQGPSLTVTTTDTGVRITASNQQSVKGSGAMAFLLRERAYQ